VTYRLLSPRLSMARSCMERVSLQLGWLKRPEAATSASQGGVSPPTVDEELLEELPLLLENDDEDEDDDDDDELEDDDDDDELDDEIFGAFSPVNDERCEHLHWIKPTGMG